MKIFLRILMLVGMVYSLGACSKGPDSSAPPPGSVTCTCFLNAHPCESSRRLEAWTRESLNQNFPNLLQSGALIYRTVDYDKKENAHFMKDYDLPFQSVVLTGRKGYVRMDKLWRWLGDEAAFKKMVRDETVKYLQGN
jgi:hypothetical protein